MAKHRGDRRYFRNRQGFVAIPFSQQITIGALDPDTVVISDVAGSQLTKSLFVISVGATWALRGNTAGEGPLGVGFAHNDLSVGEIAENLNAEMFDPSDIISKERARRPVRRTGIFPGLSTDEALEHGAVVKTKVKFTVDEGHQLGIWAANRDGSTRTTGGIVEVNGTIFARWLGR